MANGNGGASIWKAMGTLGIMGTLIFQLVLFGQWKGVMSTKIDVLTEDVQEMKRDLKVAAEDRYKGADATRDWDRHLRTYHGDTKR